MLQRIFQYFILTILALNFAQGEELLKIVPDLTNRYCVTRSAGAPFIKLLTNKSLNPLLVEIAPGQKINHLDPETPSIYQNNFTHVISLKNLSQQGIPGSIAFDTIYFGDGRFVINNAVIFTEQSPKGISKKDYLESLAENQKPVAEDALTTFLKVTPILVAAIDACRPHKAVTYATFEETERIENGRKNVYQLAKKFNTGELKPVMAKGRAITEGFYDPNFKIETPYGVTLDFEYLNPLNLKSASKELSALECEKIVSGAKLRSDAPTDPIKLAEFIYQETYGRCLKSSSL